MSENTAVSVPLCSKHALRVVALAASRGGLKALSLILSGLPTGFPAAVVVVQHLSPHHRSHLTEILARYTSLWVKWAEEGDRLHPGHVFVAPPDRHLIVNPDSTLSLSHAGRVCFVRPSANVLFASRAVSCKARAIAVVLTGGDDDGSAGVKLIKAIGGTVIAQDEASSEHFSMPHAAIAAGAVDHICPVDRIAPLLGLLTGHDDKVVRDAPEPAPGGKGTERRDDKGCNGPTPGHCAPPRRPQGVRRRARAAGHAVQD